MSHFRFKRLEQHKTGGTRDKMELTIPAPQSPSGKIHRCCPVPNCVPNLFQLGLTPANQTIAEEHLGLIRRNPGTPGITCPYCGHDAPDDEYVFRGDIKAAQDYIKWAAAQDVGDHLEQWARDLNRKLKRSGGGFISMEMKVKRSHRSRPFVWREDLLRDLTCDICGRAYGVYAIALFCPDCGTPNLHVHFQREIDLIDDQIELAKRIEGEGKKELAYRLLGNAHEDVLTAFETYLKTIYRFLVKKRMTPEEATKLCTKKEIGNRFQNIERGRALFTKLGIDPYAHLDETDLSFLRLNIEKRHVVGHNLSMADEAYVQAAQTEQPGQTVTLLAGEITRFAVICQTVVVRLMKENSEFYPSVQNN